MFSLFSNAENAEQFPNWTSGEYVLSYTHRSVYTEGVGIPILSRPHPPDNVGVVGTETLDTSFYPRLAPDTINLSVCAEAVVFVI